MMRCHVLDDEAYAGRIIGDFIEKTPSLVLTGVSTDPFKVIQLINREEIDLLFLDIQMPELTGIQVLKIVGDKCRVIITTAYPDYAVEGFDLDVVDYLMKPVSYERFLRSVQKAATLIPVNKTYPKPAEPSFLFVKGDRKNKFHKISPEDILYIEGLKNYICIHTEKEMIITYQGMSEILTRLDPEQFVRIHRSFIVSVSKIELVDGNSVTIKEKIIPIGESYRTGFFDLIGKLKI